MIPNEKLCWLTNRWSNVGVNELGEYLETVQDCCKDLFTKGSFCFGYFMSHRFLAIFTVVLLGLYAGKGKRALKGTLRLRACSLGEEAQHLHCSRTNHRTPVTHLLCFPFIILDQWSILFIKRAPTEQTFSRAANRMRKCKSRISLWTVWLRLQWKMIRSTTLITNPLHLYPIPHSQ